MQTRPNQSPKQTLGHKSRVGWMRRLALPLTLCFSTSVVFAPVAQAALNPWRPPTPPGHTRKLTPSEMRSIVGAQDPGDPHETSYATASGESFAWEGSNGGVNTGNGNKLTTVPIVGWTARGGLPVEFTLYHNSQGGHDDELGTKWTHSYDIYLGVDPGGPGGHAGDVTVHWGTDLSYTFVKNMDGSYSPPTGIFDTLVANSTMGTITSYDITKKNQVKYHFTNPNSTGFHCASISDRNSNTITINRNSGNYVTSIVDPTNRTISVSYTSGKISSISDPLSRSWSFSYTSGKLTQVTWPTVGGNSYNEQFSYDVAGDITTHKDKRGKDFTASYNMDSSLAWEKDPLLNQVSYSYTNGQTVITDPNGHTVKHNYSSGKLSSVVDQLNNSESYTWNGSNLKTGMTDRRGKSWSWTYL